MKKNYDKPIRIKKITLEKHLPDATISECIVGEISCVDLILKEAMSVDIARIAEMDAEALSREEKNRLWIEAHKDEVDELKPYLDFIAVQLKDEQHNTIHELKAASTEEYKPEIIRNNIGKSISHMRAMLGDEARDISPKAGAQTTEIEATLQMLLERVQEFKAPKRGRPSTKSDGWAL